MKFRMHILYQPFLFFLFFANNYSKPKLIDYRFNKYSQFGEDGIIKKIFEIIGTTSKICVEFGASDGLFCSNTAKLITEDNWKGILIESNSKSFASLKKNMDGFNCILLNKYVDFKKPNDIETILKNIGLENTAIDLMSIDVDGDDYYIAENLDNIKPRIIICEYNPTIPADIDFYQEAGEYVGCSVSSLVRVFNKKSYKLVAITHTNAFFADANSTKKIEAICEIDFEKIRIDDFLIHVITTYDGNPMLISRIPKYAYSAYNILRHAYKKNKVHTNATIIDLKELIINQAQPTPVGSFPTENNEQKISISDSKTRLIDTYAWFNDLNNHQNKPLFYDNAALNNYWH